MNQPENSAFLKNLPIDYFQGKNIVITGAGTGYGQALSIALLYAGANVYLLGRRLEKLQNTIDLATQVQPLRSVAMPIPCDICQEIAITKAVDSIVKRTNSIDIVIHCAGVAAHNDALLSMASLNRWDEVFDTNVKGQWMVAKAILPYMKSDSIRMLFFTSGAAWANTYGFALYNVSKAALNSLVHSLAKECEVHYPTQRISINGINPAEAKTEMNQGSNISAFEICSMVFKILSTQKNIPNGCFFHRDGRPLRFCDTREFQQELE